MKDNGSMEKSVELEHTKKTMEVATQAVGCMVKKMAMVSRHG